MKTNLIFFVMQSPRCPVMLLHHGSSKFGLIIFKPLQGI